MSGVSSLSFAHPLSNGQDLKLHIKIHTRDTLFTCEDCGVSFIRDDVLKIHRRIHTNEKPYSCEQCAVPFKHLVSLSLKEHLRVQHEDNTRQHVHSCRSVAHAVRDQSRDTCAGQEALTQQVWCMRSRRSEVPAVCGQSGDNFASKETLAQQVQHTHSRISKMLAACDQSGDIFTSPATRRQQIQHMHSRRSKVPAACDRSGNTFVSQETLMQQVQHTCSCGSEVPAACVSPAAWRRLVQHMRSCRSESYAVCDQNGDTSASQKTLRQHMVRHGEGIDSNSGSDTEVMSSVMSDCLFVQSDMESKIANVKQRGDPACTDSADTTDFVSDPCGSFVNDVAIETEFEMPFSEPYYREAFQSETSSVPEAEILTIHFGDETTVDGGAHTDDKLVIKEASASASGETVKLNQSSKRVTTGKKNVCEHCPSSFGRSDSLKRHIRTHTKEKPFKCEICGNCFRV